MMRIFKKNSSRLSSGRRRAGLRRGASGLRIGRITAGIVILFLVLAFVFARSTTFGLLWRAIAPINFLAQRVVAGGEYFTLPFASKADLLAENTTLEAELAEARAEAVDRGVLAQQNAELKTELGRSETEPQKTLAYIVARPPELPYDMVVVDAGSTQGIAVQDIVSVGSAAIGFVSDAAGGISRVTLFSSPGQTTNGLLQGVSPITIVGVGGSSLTAQVPQGTDVSVGDAVTIPGSQPIVIATVESVSQETGVSYKTINLSLAADIFSVQSVEVLHEPLAPNLTSIATTSNMQ